MIDRYTLPEMGAVWTEENKFRSWLKVEIAAREVNVRCENPWVFLTYNADRIPNAPIAPVVTSW